MIRMDDGMRHDWMHRRDDRRGDQHWAMGMNLSDTLMRDGGWQEYGMRQQAWTCDSETQQGSEHHKLCNKRNNKSSPCIVLE